MSQPHTHTHTHTHSLKSPIATHTSKVKTQEIIYHYPHYIIPALKPAVPHIRSISSIKPLLPPSHRRTRRTRLPTRSVRQIPLLWRRVLRHTIRRSRWRVTRLLLLLVWGVSVLVLLRGMVLLALLRTLLRRRRRSDLFVWSTLRRGRGLRGVAWGLGLLLLVGRVRCVVLRWGSAGWCAVEGCAGVGGRVVVPCC